MKKIFLSFILLSLVFSAFSQAPTITSFNPASGPVGTLVTIKGTNLSSPTAFTIGGVSAILVSGSSDSIAGMVMPGAATGSVSVTTSGGTVSGSGIYIVTPTLYPHTQQGAVLVGNNVIDSPTFADQGTSVAISADGNTAIAGGSGDNNDVGAAWIFVRTGSGWVQQGPKLVGIGAVGSSNQGWSVALSADGNTAIVGGIGDNSGDGAAWIYTRSGATWSQQGSKLVGTGAVNVPHGGTQGSAVSLSADGNTAIVGGDNDSSGIGAVWFYTRSGNVWTQQGPKVVGSGRAGTIVNQGIAVSLSADGNTAIVGGSNDNNAVGAAWIFNRSSGIWSQQGPKLVGTGYVDLGYVYEGCAVSISADGNTAIIGAFFDSTAGTNTGAAWVFVRSGGVWSQQGAKLVGTGAIGGAAQGTGVSISADGNTALVGGNTDNSTVGATWVYRRTGNVWAQQGQKLVGSGNNAGAFEGIAVALSATGSTAIIGGWEYVDTGGSWIFISQCSNNSSTTYDTISAGALPYTWNGLTFTTAAAQTAYMAGSGGCDSAATLILTVRPDGISEINTPSPIHLYPNPNKGSFTLQTSNCIGSDYMICDMLGHVILQQAIKSDTETIELPDATEGVYTLAVRDVYLPSAGQPVRFVIIR